MCKSSIVLMSGFVSEHSVIGARNTRDHIEGQGSTVLLLCFFSSHGEDNDGLLCGCWFELSLVSNVK